MADLSSTSDTTSEDERKEQNYYKTPKLIKRPKTPKTESDSKKKVVVKFKKEKYTIDPAEVAITQTSEDIVSKTIIDNCNTLLNELKLGIEPLPYKNQGDLWMTVGEFNQNKARQHLENFVSSWNLSEEWLYCIRFVDMKKKQYDDVYTYQVIWSIPTQEQPIPKATASVYFSFEVSLLKPRYYPINVYFSFECSRLVHLPGKTRIKEHSLRSIIDSKLLISNSITF